jgi:mannose-6-phosphate isomerase
MHPARGTTLDAAIAADPVGTLGADVVTRFGARLPFLLKLLAADQALSIQVHPTIEQARAGFAAEELAGIPRDGWSRNYRDDNHKPELICALTDFEAVCGFRDPAETVGMLDALAVAELAALRSVLADGGLRAAVTYLVTLDDPKPVIEALSSARIPPRWAGTARAIELAARDFPGDIGIALAALLNYVRLVPGEALFLGAGNVHAYLRGLGVEIMANSDNVLRGGLTPKHIDVAELLKIADFTPLDEPRFCGERTEFGADFAAPVPDFRLLRIDLGARGGTCALALEGPLVVLSVTGTTTIAWQAESVTLTAGRAAFVGARDSGLTLSGHGLAFVATHGIPGTATPTWHGARWRG